MAWARPDQIFGYFAMMYMAVWLVTTQKILQLRPVVSSADFISMSLSPGGIFAYLCTGLFFGYHYKTMGNWLSLPSDAKKA